jgi:hypothetical protein
VRGCLVEWSGITFVCHRNRPDRSVGAFRNRKVMKRTAYTWVIGYEYGSAADLSKAECDAAGRKSAVVLGMEGVKEVLGMRNSALRDATLPGTSVRVGSVLLLWGGAGNGGGKY